MFAIKSVCQVAAAMVTAAVLTSSVAFAQHSKAAAKTETVNVKVDNGFKPSTIKVHSGETVKLVFDGINPGCVDSVVFPSLHITKKVTKGQKTVVSFTPKKTGTIPFACRMGMMKGSVVVR